MQPYCEDDVELSSSVKDVQFLKQLSDNITLKKKNPLYEAGVLLGRRLILRKVYYPILV